MSSSFTRGIYESYCKVLEMSFVYAQKKGKPYEDHQNLMYDMLDHIGLIKSRFGKDEKMQAVTYASMAVLAAANMEKDSERKKYLMLAAAEQPNGKPHEEVTKVAKRYLFQRLQIEIMEDGLENVKDFCDMVRAAVEDKITEKTIKTHHNQDVTETTENT